MENRQGKLIRGTLINIAVLLQLTISSAQTAPVTDTQIREALDYVTDNLGDKDLTPPIVVQNDREFDAILSNIKSYPIKSFYVEGLVYLRESFTQEDMPLLVHEMTHYWQQVNREPFPCNAAKELEAYALQNKYAADHNMPRLIMGEQKIAILSSCHDTK